MDERERILLVELAREFYLEDRSKTELAHEYGLSRFKVARMLEQARAEGLVRIEIDDGGVAYRPEALELQKHLGLRDCVIVPAEAPESSNRRSLARAAANFIIARSKDGDRLGFSWGRTLSALGEYLSALPPVDLVQLTGTVGNDLAQSPIEVIRKIADRTSVRTFAVFAPLFARDAGAAATMQAEPANAATMAFFDQIDIAVLSIGSWSPPITQLDEFFTASEKAALDNAGALAEMAGIFIKPDGAVARTPVDGRRTSISVEQLLATPRVLGVAGGVEKAPAILAVARSGLVTSLVTDSACAEALMAMPPVRGHALERASR